MKHSREPAVAGMFYSADPLRLKNDIENLLASWKPENELESIIGIVAPHAGYLYSGRTAAAAYNLIKNKEFKTVIIISPSHREYFPGVTVFDGDEYETPLGAVPVNKEMREKLVKDSKYIFTGSEGHGQEHAVEVQIPFLQMVLKDFSIVPVVMGDQRKIFVDELAEKIASAADEKTLIVASSDLSHFYSKEKAFQLDSVVEDKINNFDYEGLLNDLESKRCEACGGGPIVAMMKAASLMNKNKSVVLDRSDSGDTTGDNSEVVGYLSAAVYG